MAEGDAKRRLMFAIIVDVEQDRKKKSKTNRVWLNECGERPRDIKLS